MGMITLRQLRYLQALARYRHFGRAAEACAVTQPALSMQIRELEKELDVELIDRRPGDAALTEIGVLVAKRGDEVLAAARDLVDFARHQGRLFEGELKLGVIPTLAPYLLPKLLPLLQAERIKLLRFAAPEPSRTIGLAFRRTSPRKQDFVALGRLVVEAMAGDLPRPARATTNSRAV